MKLKFMTILLAMAMFLAVTPNNANSEMYYVSPGYTYYNLPPGYHYENWNRGPVIVNSLTGELVTFALLQNMFPYHQWYMTPPPPHFRHDWRYPLHRRGWERRHHNGHYSHFGHAPHRPRIHHRPPHRFNKHHDMHRRHHPR